MPPKDPIEAAPGHYGESLPEGTLLSPAAVPLMTLRKHDRDHEIFLIVQMTQQSPV
jgi:hypothetical protein